MKRFSSAIVLCFLASASLAWAEIAPVPVLAGTEATTLSGASFLDLCTAGIGNDLSPAYTGADGQSFYSEGGIVCFGKSPLRIAADAISLAPITDKRKEGVAARSFTFVEVQWNRAYVTYKDKDYDFSLVAAPAVVAPVAPVPEIPVEEVAIPEIPVAVPVEENGFPWIKIVGALVVVILLGGAGFVGYRKYRAHKKMMDMPPAAVIPLTPAPVPDIVMTDVSAGFPMPHPTQPIIASAVHDTRMTEDSIVMPVSTPLPPTPAMAMPAPMSEEVPPTHPM